MNNKTLYVAFQSAPNVEPTQEELNSFQRKYKKDFKNRELYQGEELLNEFKLRSWKHPRFSKIISFIVAFEIEGKMRVRYISGEEKDTIQEFFNILQKSKEYQVVLFDAQITLPFLGIRSIRNGFSKIPHSALSYQNQRPWSLQCIDLQQYYDGAGNYKSSLKDIAEDYNLDCSQVIEVEDEFTYFHSNQTNELKQSAIRKVELMSEVWRSLNGLEKLETEVVEESVKDVQEEKPKDWVAELYHEDRLSKEVKEGLKQQLKGKKKPTKKEKEELYQILRGVYVQTNFISGQQDNKETVKRKEEEIKEFLEEVEW